MKEGLLKLKKEIGQLDKVYKNFRKQKEFFEMKVAEKIGENKDEYVDVQTSYEDICNFDFYFKFLSGIEQTVREEYPKYGDRRIKEMMSLKLIDELEMDEENEDDFNFTSSMVSTYFLYKSCGYEKIRVLDLELARMHDNVKATTNDIINQPKEVLVKTGNALYGIIKPYGEVARSQLFGAAKITKGAINQGSKKLTKVLKKIEKMTDDNGEE